jgi:agmatine deiminase
MAEQFRQPAEWAPHAAVWTAWPYNEPEWGEPLKAAQGEFVQMCEAIADCDPETGKPRGEALKILIPPDLEEEPKAFATLRSLGAELIPVPYGDIWLRDTAPIFVRDAVGQLAARVFSFNGWGGKYIMPGDELVPKAILDRVRVPSTLYDLVFEGGSIDVDGIGNAITTRECLLNSNRNPSLNADEIEAQVKEALGIEQMIWIDRGLHNDHTDGHLDNVARFIGPEKVMCMAPYGEDDPNAGLYAIVRETLENAPTASGRPLEVVSVPSPGRVENADGLVVPASHMNFYLSNTRVVVPYYETIAAEKLIAAFAPHFPDREIVVIPAPAILSGGGSFHCITQQQPAL